MTPGGKVQIDCTGLPALHPYLLLEVSLVIGIDPSTAGLLSGAVSPSLLLSVLSALPIINPSALSVTASDESGNLDYSYTTPTTQAPDPNASCPPSQEEFNSGLIGCALALVDLTTASAVGAGSAIIEYQGFPLFPPGPTLAIHPKKVSPGQTVKIKDAKGATTYWWLATLSSLEGLLGGSSAPPTVSVKIQKVATAVQSDASVTPASYDGTTFTPPVLSGTFVVPSTLAAGVQKVLVSLVANLSGLPITLKVAEPVTVS
jgi:hypothetical protein